MSTRTSATGSTEAKWSADRQATAAHMAGYRDLPMGRHDRQALAAPKVLDAFSEFVRLEQELLTLVRQAIERDQQMLAVMRGQP